MLILSLARIIKFSFQDIGRNIWLSIVTVTILVLALFSVNMLLVVREVGETAIGAVKEKVDINIYIKSDAKEEEILALRGRIDNMSWTEEVTYISKTEALKFFRGKNKNNPEVLQALRELGRNPLAPSLIIKPKEFESSEELFSQLNNLKSEIIESRNFTDHKLMLEKINSITNKVSSVGMTISIIFGITFLIIIFNSLRISIYTHRREIAIMKLVGASNPFVYMPFIVSSLIYALVGVAIVIAIFFPFLSLLQPYLEAFFIGYDINIFSYFTDNFINIFGLQFLGVAVINVLASLIAARKYTRV